MKKMFWILGAAAVVVIAAVTVFAMQPKGSPAAFSIPIVGAARINVPQGTVLAMRLQTTLSTKTANVGDRFEAGVSSPVHVNGKLAIPEGAQITGHVMLTDQPGKTSGRGQLQLAYDQVRFDGHSYNLGSHSQIYESKSGTTKDVAMIGGGAVAGGIVGAVLGGGSGAAKGAVIGGAAGTGASLMTRGPQLELERGMALQLRLDQAVSVRAPKAAV
jgi:acetyltransferase-like isoleucine patch superfamily enzyme